jgi:hypothetical protein
VSAIDAFLEKMGNKWVFVFDQINKLFVKPNNLKARDASGLAYLFFMIKRVMKAGRITSVISASANNEISYKEKHEAFDEYVHRNDMTPEELQLAFPADTFTETLDHVEKLTGNVPLFLFS